MPVTKAEGLDPDTHLELIDKDNTGTIWVSKIFDEKGFTYRLATFLDFVAPKEAKKVLYLKYEEVMGGPGEFETVGIFKAQIYRQV